MEGKKQQLVEIIQELTRQANCKQQAIVMMTGMMRCLDELILPGVKRAEKSRQKLNEYRVLIEDDEVRRLMFMNSGGFEAQQFFQKGSNLTIDNYSSLDSLPLKKQIPKRQVLDAQYNSRGYYTQKKNLGTLLKHTLKMNPTIFKQVKLNRKQLEMEKFQQTQIGIQFFNHVLEAYNTKTQKTLFRDEDRSVNLDDQIVTAYEFNNLEEMERKFEELKTKVRFKAEEEQRSNRGSETKSLQSDPKKSSLVSTKKDPSEPVTEGRASSKAGSTGKNKELTEYQSANSKKSLQQGYQSKPKTPSAMQPEILEDDIEVIDDDEINYTLDDQSKNKVPNQEPELLPYSDEEQDEVEKDGKEFSNLSSPAGKNNDTFERDFPAEGEIDGDLKNDTLGLDDSAYKEIGADNLGVQQELSDDEMKEITEVFDEDQTQRASIKGSELSKDPSQRLRSNAQINVVGM